VKIILASASQRRKNLLDSLGIPFSVVASEINETEFLKPGKKPQEIVQEIALAKGLEIKNRIKAKDFLIISADTIAVFKNSQGTQILGKPKNRKEASQMLILLRNRMHRILTGVVFINKTGIQGKFLEESKVFFKNFSSKELEDYLDTNTYLDRAGAYGIQDKKCDFIKKYEGSYSNILGLPIEKIMRYLHKLGIKTSMEERV